MRTLDSEHGSIDLSSGAICKEMKMGMKPPFCPEEVLFSNRDCTIWQCRCGIYHVRIHAIRLHLTMAQFERVARVFKLMMGRAAASKKEERVTLGQYDAVNSIHKGGLYEE